MFIYTQVTTLLVFLMVKNMKPYKFNSRNEIIKFIHKNIKKTIVLYGIDLEEPDFVRIVSNKWFNDKMINLYFYLVEKYSREVLSVKIYNFSTYFFTKLIRCGVKSVQKWFENVNLFSFDFLYFPIHRSHHWSFVNVNLKTFEIEYWDSLNGGYTEAFRIFDDEINRDLQFSSPVVWEILKPIVIFLNLEKQKVNLPKICYKIIKMKCPQQPNGIDCGLFVCLFARGRICGRTMPYDLNLYDSRLKLCYELMVGEILYNFDHKFTEL